MDNQEKLSPSKSRSLAGKTTSSGDGQSRDLDLFLGDIIHSIS
ncbi:unnamed protein product [Arabidopsis halleri]